MIYYLTPQGNGVSLDGTLPNGAVECTQAQYEAAASWTVSNGQVVAYTPPPLSLAQQAQALAAAGLAVTSTGNAALDATYAVDAATINYINSEISAILVNGTFADGTTMVQWPDLSGALHAFNVTQFKALASVLAAFVAGIRQCVIGVIGAVLPAATATIA